MTFTDGRQQRQARTWGEARELHALGWIPAPPAFPESRAPRRQPVERVVPALTWCSASRGQRAVRPLPHRVLGACLTGFALVGLSAACDARNVVMDTPSPSARLPRPPNPDANPIDPHRPRRRGWFDTSGFGPAGSPWTAVQLSLVGEGRKSSATGQ